MSEHSRSGERILRGIPVSGGVCRGKIVVLGKARDAIPRHEISEAEVPQEIQRLEHALTQTREQILKVQRKVSEAMGAKDASIFDAHLLVLEDPTLIDEVTRVIQEKKINAEHAFQQVAEKYAATLSSMDDEYLRERSTDMRDVTARVLDNLLGRTGEGEVGKLKEPCIIISYDLAPSTTALFDRKMVLGFATDAGSRTSHTAIKARSLQIPAVVGLHDASKQLNTGQYALLDGYNGLLIVSPTDQTLFEYGQLVRKRVNLQEKLRDIRDESAITLDGVRITLSANVEQAADAEHVRACGAEGVGLFRTEYLFLNRETLPDEEEQYLAYRQVAAALKPHPVVVRTLDLGGDKFLSHLQMPQELNPFLGWRAIRFCLEERDIFRAQLRAILRAAVEGNIKMMYPMISGLDELNQANALVEECRKELKAERIPFGDALEIGAMIEIPSAVLAADSLAKRVKFFSIGTNDLIQYSLAVDRLNEKIAHLYEPTHPAIVRLIKATVDAGHRNGIWVGVCGEMAGDPTLVPLLLGLGVDELSAAFSVVPQVKFLIRRLKMSEARELAEFALNCECGSEILARSQELAQRIAPGLLENQN
ncbi:MAG: phosphoenolpyruvate--protein phosphotransferase [Verrucomicrobia bacterium]|nr:MAG: phosphoenolpyruvate--protein phosphotransferase [Verrucomicrobiota bacterium]